MLMGKNVEVVMILLFGSLAIGAVLFFIARLFVRTEIKNTDAPKAKKSDFLHAFMVVGGLLILVYLSTEGYVWTGILFAFIMLVFQLWGNYLVRKKQS
jgi:hypothetical protein